MRKMTMRTKMTTRKITSLKTHHLKLIRTRAKPTRNERAGADRIKYPRKARTGEGRSKLTIRRKMTTRKMTSLKTHHLQLIRTRTKPTRNARAGADRIKYPRKESACAERSRPRTVLVVTQRTMQKISPAPQVLSGMPRGDVIRSIV